MKKQVIILTITFLSMAISIEAQPIENTDNQPQTDVAVMADSIMSNVEVARLEEELSFYQLLVSPGVNVFNETVDEANVPLCLKEHFGAIQKIIQVRELLEKVEGTIKQLAEENQEDQVIYNTIENDMIDLYEMYSEIKGLSLSTFSEEQKAYFKPGLTERYNLIVKKYFE